MQAREKGRPTPQRPTHSNDQRSGSRSGASRPHSKPPEQLTASCRGRRDQRVETVAFKQSAVNRPKPSRPKPAADCAPRPLPPAAALCWLRRTRPASSWSNAVRGGPRAVAEPAWGHHQPGAITTTRGCQARQGGLRDWLPQCHGHRQRSSCSSAGSNATACPGHRIAVAEGACVVPQRH
jgi:hypothetical protein